MKSYSFFISIILASLTTVLFGQLKEAPATLDWGQQLKEPSSTLIDKLVATTKDGFYILRRKQPSAFAGEKIYLEFYDNNLNIKKSSKLDLEYKGKERNFENLLMVGGQLYLFTSFNNEGKKKNYLFVQGIHNRRLTLAKKFEKIAEINSRNKERVGSFNFELSRDSSKVLLYNQIPYRKNNPESFGLIVFDNKFQKLWEKNINLPYDDEQFSIEEYQIDNQGNVYLLGVVYKDKSRARRRGTPNYEYVIYAYRNGGEDVQEYAIELKDKFITDLTFRINKNGNLICSGFYSEKGTYSVKGTYFFHLDAKSKQVISQNLKPFDFDFLTEHLSVKKKAKAAKAEKVGDIRGGAELYDYALNDLIIRSDGGAVLIAEQYYVEVQNFNRFNGPYAFNRFYYDPFFDPFYYNRFGNNRNDYYYNYNDIIIVNIKPNGEIEWATRIPKRQETKNDWGFYSSYSMATVRDKLYFVFNENVRNFSNSEKTGKLYNFNGRNSVMALAEVRIDGSYEVYPLASNRDAGIITRPKICKQIGRKEMLIYGEQGRGYRFANLTFD